MLEPRSQQLSRLIENGYKLISEIENQLLVTTYSTERARLNSDIEKTAEQIKRYEAELEALESKPARATIDSNSITPPPRSLRVFLCHSSGDKKKVRELYRRLQNEPGLMPWLDEEELLPGQNWDLEIRKAVRTSDSIIICLSRGSITKEGYVQKEIKLALDVANEKPSGTIFVIPLKLEDCEVPFELSHLQWMNYYENEDRNFEQLLKALRYRATNLPGVATA